MDFECNMSAIDSPKKQTLYGLIDPTFQRSHRLVYEKAVPIRLQYSDYDGNSKDLGEEYLVVRILVQGVETVVNEIRIELRSEQDIYFNLDCIVNEEAYTVIQNRQKLTVSYEQFQTAIIKCLNNLLDRQTKQKMLLRRMNAVLNMAPDGKGQLIISQSSQYRNVQVFSLTFIEQTEEYVTQTISHRYFTVKRKAELSQIRLKKVIDIIAQKNPSLLEQIQRVPAFKPQQSPPKAVNTSKLSTKNSLKSTKKSPKK